MKQGLLITGGTLNLDFAGSFLQGKAFDAVIAADAGLEQMKRLGLIPHAVVGDFDTVDKTVFQEFHQLKEISWEVHKPEKDETDTELAIITAMNMGCTHLTILGATGGRFDHTLGNVQLLKLCLDRGVSASIVDEKNRISLVDRERTFHKSQSYGTYISFLPLTETVEGITLTGFKYPLSNKTITVGSSLCISNELKEESGHISLKKGILVCVESHD